MSVLLNPFQLLELHIISAQDLAPVSRSMRTYAIVWINPDRKLSTRVDAHGKFNPTWNDRFVFKVDEEFIRSDTSAVNIEIYSVHWLKDVLVGTVRMLIGNVIPPRSRPFHRQPHVGMQFVALQVRRPSGRPQGIINVGVALLDSSMRSMPLNSELSVSLTVTTTNNQDHTRSMINSESDKLFREPGAATVGGTIIKPMLRRTKSDSSSMQAVADGNKLKRKVSFRERLHSIISASEGDSSTQDQKLIKGSNSTPASMVNGYYVSHPNENTIKAKADKSSGDSYVSGSDVRGAVKVMELNEEVIEVDLREQQQNMGMKRSSSRKFLTESELGPSPSEVAVAVAAAAKEKSYRRVAPDDVVAVESSVVMGSVSESMEGLQSKLERWRMELPIIYDRSEIPSFSPSVIKSSGRGHGRRHTDGGSQGGLFSCFSNICGCECSIVCGGSSPPKTRPRSSGSKGRHSHSPLSNGYV